MMALLAVLTGCADQESQEPTPVVGDTPVAVNFAFSMPDVAARTRMTDEVIQTSYDLFRGLKDVHIIPFKVAGTITRDHLPFVYDNYGGDETGRVTGKPSELTQSAYYYYPDCAFWSGTASVLFYGRGANSVLVDGETIPASNKAYYGSTATTDLDVNAPALIRFSPDQIWPSETLDDRAQALADYMTAVANTAGWASAEDPKLKALYLNFLHRDAAGDYAVMGGSSANIRAFVEELYDEVGLFESDETLAEAIRTSIKTGADVEVDNDGMVTSVTLKDQLTGYPANIGLPDGAAALQWNGTEFTVHIQTTVESAITSIDRFAWPAELCYYGNSTIVTSGEKVEGSVYLDAKTWNDVLDHYTNGPMITSSTKSAAMVYPVQYGVARLSVRLKKIEVTPFMDVNGELVAFDDTYYPLTAVIVGGQYPVGFDFRPETVQQWPTDEAASKAMTNQMFFVCDTQVKTKELGGNDGYDYYYLSNTEDEGCTNTLLLQSYEGKNVKIVLEFENRSGKKFMGYDGIVYPGTKFYLIGEVNPTAADDGITDENKKRVFTQDYTTTFDVQVESFMKAYNVMPDLLAPRMEIGIKVENWQTVRPTTVELLKR